MMKDNDVIVVIFSKEQVRHCKLAHFLKQFGRDALPQGPALAALMNRFRFLVDGYDNDPQELYAIPEVRKFYQYSHRVWPYWFYFCDLQSETLTMLTLCLLPNVSGFKRLGEPMAKVQFDPMDLLRFIEKNFVPLNTMMVLAGLSEMEIYNRIRDVFHHFHLPYDAPPPEE